jgi:hypothetical protein
MSELAVPLAQALEKAGEINPKGHLIGVGRSVVILQMLFIFIQLPLTVDRLVEILVVSLGASREMLDRESVAPLGRRR